MSRCLYLEYGSACDCGPCREGARELARERRLQRLTPEQRVERLRQHLAERGEQISPAAESLLLEAFRQQSAGVLGLQEEVPGA